MSDPRQLVRSWVRLATGLCNESFMDETAAMPNRASTRWQERLRLCIGHDASRKVLGAVGRDVEWAADLAGTAGRAAPYAAFGLPKCRVFEVTKTLRRHSHRHKSCWPMWRVLDPVNFEERSCKAAWILWLGPRDNSS